MMSCFQPLSLRRKYSRCRSFMKGSSSVGRYPSSIVILFAMSAFTLEFRFPRSRRYRVPIVEREALHNGDSSQNMVEEIQKRLGLSGICVGVAFPAVIARLRPKFL